MPQRSVGFTWGRSPRGHSYAEKTTQEDRLPSRAQWVLGPVTQMLQPPHPPPTECLLPTKYQGWSDTKNKSLSPKRPTSRMGSSPAGPGSSALGRCAAGRLRTQALESGMYSSSPSVGISVCPRASDIPHATPVSHSCSEGPVRLNSWVPSSEGQPQGYVSPLALT